MEKKLETTTIMGYIDAEGSTYTGQAKWMVCGETCPGPVKPFFSVLALGHMHSFIRVI